MSFSKNTFSLQEFLDSPDLCEALRARLRYRTELIDREITPKMSPK